MSVSELNKKGATFQFYDVKYGLEDSLKRVGKTPQILQDPLGAGTTPTWSNPVFQADRPKESADIFSKLDDSVFSDSENAQMGRVMRKFRRMFYKRVGDYAGAFVFPKLEHFVDDSEADVVRLASVWDQGNAMLYFSFEKNEEESSYGLIWDDKVRKNYESRTGNIFLNDEDKIIHEVCNFIERAFV